MKKIIPILLIIAISLCSESRKTLVVLPLFGENMADEGLAILTKKLNASLTEAGTFLVVDQDEVTQFVENSSSKVDSLDSLKQITVVGEHFNVNYAAAGTVHNDNGTYFSSITVFDVKQLSVVKTVNDTLNGYIRDVVEKSIPQSAYRLSSREFPQGLREEVDTVSIESSEASLYIRPYHNKSDVYLNGELLGKGSQDITRPAGTYTVYEQFKGETKNSMEVTAPADKFTEIRLGGNRVQFSVVPTVSFIPNVISVTKVNGVENKDVDGVFLYGAEMGFTFENRYYFGVNGHFHVSDHWFNVGAAADWKYLFQPHRNVTLGTGVSIGMYVIGNNKYYDDKVIGKDEHSYYYKDSVIVDTLTEYENVFTENYLLPTIFGTAEIGSGNIRFYTRVDLMVQLATGSTTYHAKDDMGNWYYNESIVGEPFPENEDIFDATISPLITTGVKFLFGKKK